MLQCHYLLCCCYLNFSDYLCLCAYLYTYHMLNNMVLTYAWVYLCRCCIYYIGIELYLSHDTAEVMNNDLRELQSCIILHVHTHTIQAALLAHQQAMNAHAQSQLLNVTHNGTYIYYFTYFTFV